MRRADELRVKNKSISIVREGGVSATSSSSVKIRKFPLSHLQKIFAESTHKIPPKTALLTLRSFIILEYQNSL